MATEGKSLDLLYLRVPYSLSPFASLIFTQLLYVIFTHISSSCIACFMQDLPELPQVLKETLQGKHSLLAAAALGNVQVVSEHIAKGADLGARNLRGRTALMLARKNGLDDIVKMLLKAGADINTSIHSAAYNGHTESITALLQGGAAVDAKLEVRGALLSFMSRASREDIALDPCQRMCAETGASRVGSRRRAKGKRGARLSSCAS